MTVKAKMKVPQTRMAASASIEVEQQLDAALQLGGMVP